ncbi:MAG TPA: hypothetical protein V6C90_22220 [Coleofasciculaceae cyanobacterium]
MVAILEINLVLPETKYVGFLENSSGCSIGKVSGSADKPNRRHTIQPGQSQRNNIFTQ